MRDEIFGVNFRLNLSSTGIRNNEYEVILILFSSDVWKRKIVIRKTCKV